MRLHLPTRPAVISRIIKHPLVSFSSFIIVLFYYLTMGLKYHNHYPRLFFPISLFLWNAYRIFILFFAHNFIKCNSEYPYFIIVISFKNHIIFYFILPLLSAKSLPTSAIAATSEKIIVTLNTTMLLSLESP